MAPGSPAAAPAPAPADTPGVLQSLQELPLPSPVSWTPQTAGWIGVAIVLIAAALCSAWAVWGRHVRRRYRRVALAQLACIEAEFGLAATIKSDSQPGIAELVEVEAPGGNIFQFYSAIEAPAPGFKKTGVAPLRLGHYAVISSEGDRLLKFYKDFLGFWYTDDIQGIATFLTCNRDHHVVNVVTAPEARVHHIAFELKGNSDHAVAADTLRAAGIKQLWGPSRHTAGHNLAAYHHDPDRVMVELYTDMDQFIPDLGIHEPRPWHEHFPMKPRTWQFTELNAWGAEFAFNLATG